MIDWAAVEADLGLTGRKLAQLAQVSTSMWCQVRQKRKNFSPAVEVLLVMRLSMYLNLQNAKEIQELHRYLEQNVNYFQQTYPLEASCVTKT